MDKKKIKYWLALSRLKGCDAVLKELLAKFDEPEKILAQTKTSLEGFSTALARSVQGFNDWDWVDTELRLIKEHGARVLTFSDPEYPEPLKQIDDPPCILYAKGATYDSKNITSVAVVGTRHPTHYGLRMAESISRDLAGMGIAVVSGMARGCDTAAHKGALSANGFTVAVLGTGVDIAYPRENTRLYEDIAKKGLVLSEFPISTPPAPYNFPRRNRIISGLSRATLVVEAPLKSGALMTAQLALDYNRDVFAVPGQASSLKSSGTNKLIKDGALLVENAQDVMNALSLQYSTAVNPVEPEFKDDEKLLWRTLKNEPLHIDSIIEKTGLTAGRTSAILLEMELKGFVEQYPGKRFLRRF